MSMRACLPIAAFATLAVSFFVPPTRAQDAEKIIDQYIKAQGGAKNLAKAQTISIYGSAQYPSHLEFSMPE